MPEIVSKQIQVQGFNIRCLKAGERGPLVLLLHGAGTDSAQLSWGEVIGPLAANHRVYAPDLPGYGDSDRPDTAYTTDFYVSFLGELLDTLGLLRASLVGLSMGGALALGAALRWPERVNRLALVDTYGIQRKVAMHKLSYLMVITPGVLEATWASVRASRAMGRASLRNIFHDPRSVPEALIDEIYAEARKPHAGRAFTRYQRHDMRWNGLRTVYLDRLDEIHAPTLFIHGRQDKAVPLACAEEAHALLPGSQLQVIDGAGHWPQREKPAEFLKVIQEFLM